MFDLRMYNVGFGDCFLFNDTSSLFLVDCGTCSIKSAPFTNFGDFINLLLKEFDTDKYKVGLISHFHIDHYKGFQIMANKNQKAFDKIYVPYMYFNNKGECILVDLAIYILLTLSPNSQAHALARNILYHIVDLLKIVNGNNVVSLSQGDQISFGLSEVFEVLWPPKYDCFLDSGLKDFIKEINTITKGNTDFDNLRQEIMKNMKEWFELISTEDKGDSTKEHNFFENVYNKQTELLSRLESMKNDNINILSYENKKSLIHKYSRTLLKSNHMANIVFHNERFLMLGDIDRTIVNKEISDQFFEEYYVIKAPHHGTKTHYVQLPEASKILISTGERARYKKISKEYSTHNGQKVCSGGINWCETLDSGSNCGGVCAICSARV